jgi:hypothetical protein
MDPNETTRNNNFNLTVGRGNHVGSGQRPSLSDRAKGYLGAAGVALVFLIAGGIWFNRLAEQARMQEWNWGFSDVNYVGPIVLLSIAGLILIGIAVHYAGVFTPTRHVPRSTPADWSPPVPMAEWRDAPRNLATNDLARLNLNSVQPSAVDLGPSGEARRATWSQVHGIQ